MPALRTRQGRVIGFAAVLLLIACIGLLFTPSRASAQPATQYTIRDDATGGDCALIGTWEAATKTCTLTGDITISGEKTAIAVADNGITLNGNGHVLAGPSSPAGWGVYMNGVQNVTVKGLKVQNFRPNVYLARSSNNTIEDNFIFHSGSVGILVDGGSANTIVHNWISSNSSNGMSLGGSSNFNLITGNTVSLNGEGINIGFGGTGNTITGNTIGKNYLALIYYANYYSTWSMQIYNNNIISNTDDVAIDSNASVGSILWNQALPVGGNYWSKWAGPDLDGNGIVDSSLSLPLGADNLPWAAPNAWPGAVDDMPPSIGNITPHGNITSQPVIFSADLFDLSGIDTASVAVTLDGTSLGGCTVTQSQVSCPYAAPVTIGSHEIAVTAADVSGNAITVNSDFTYGAIPLSLLYPSSYWASYNDYLTRYLSVVWPIQNNWDMSAYQVQITGSSGTDGVQVVSRLPSAPVDINPWAVVNITIIYRVPAGVTKWYSSVSASAMDSHGAIFTYPNQQTA